jgi:Glucose-6-phosphate dehydrogenase, C-terminal domain
LQKASVATISHLTGCVRCNDQAPWAISGSLRLILLWREIPLYEIVARLRSRHPGETDAYKRVLTDAMSGDRTLFAREDYIEEAWRIVDPVVTADTPLYEYVPGTWGPREAATITPQGGWHGPTVV